jgi:methylated-DNA-[protein]-cysteine S-methyltransferase
VPTIVTKSKPRAVRSVTTAQKALSDAACYAFTTELGAVAVAWRGESITRISIGHSSEAAALAALSSEGAKPAGNPPAFVLRLADRLQCYASGERGDDFWDVPLDLSHLSPFQKRVVQNCRRISTGRTRTYGELAGLAGSPGAARAVGNVMSGNRFPIVVPCHRVVGSAGSLGGFSAPQGTSLKRRMLALEGATLGVTSRSRKPR